MFERTDPSSSSARPVALTRAWAAVIVVLAATAAVFGVRIFLGYVESVHGYDDVRDEQVTLIFGSVMAALCAWSLYKIYRRP